MTSSTDIALQDGDHLAAAFEHARVADVMRAGVFACSASTPLAGVARIMATNHVHCVVVTGVGVDERGRVAPRAWSIVSDLDLVRAADAGGDAVAGEMANHGLAAVSPTTPLPEAAKLMADRGATHLIVEDPDSGQPLGVVSTLDIAGNLAWARG